MTAKRNEVTGRPAIGIPREGKINPIFVYELLPYYLPIYC
jgi:hypothetical protein